MHAGTGVTDEHFLYKRAQRWLSVLLVAASFFIYAAAALIVQHHQKSDFIPERSSIAAAVSNVLYDARLGSVYSGVLDQFLQMNRPLAEIVGQAARKEIVPDQLLPTISDGNGVGYILIASLGFRLFGVGTSSATLVMLVLMGTSAFAFLWRFRDRRSLVVILYFTCLTLMLFTPLVWATQNAVNIPVGGIRYFSFVSILPAFHLLLELADKRRPRYLTHLEEFLPLAAQVSIMGLAVLVRNSTLPIVAAIVVGGVLFVCRGRRVPGATARTLSKAIQMVVVACMFIGGLALLVSKDYIDNGRFNGVVWHRIFVSLGLSPDWPFGNLRQIYDCTRYIPEGLVNGPEDRNGHCVLWAYAIKHNITPDVVPTLTYGRVYETATREAFFNIAWLYPVETLKTFFVTKMQYIPWSIGASLEMKFTGVQAALIWFLLAALGNLLIFSVVPSPIRSPNNWAVIVSATALLAVFSIPPLLAVWAMPHTSADLLFYCFFGVGLAAIATIEKVGSLVWSSLGKPSI